ncbi:class I adenylate-forming enzyme family protein [Streptomyces sp. NPDC053429]|uniref:class I adenylate-forming enzyme family protein n=1 Tax=Streptomyces sp. NPDC053429 TaxID=3365702 RepID=UPI0037D088E3
MTDALEWGGDRIAVHDAIGPLSYRELSRWSRELAHQVLAAGGGDAEVVPLLLPNSASWLAAYAALLRTGSIVAPLNPALTSAEIARVLDRSRPRLVLTTAARRAEVSELCTAAGLAPRVRILVVPPRPPASAPAAGKDDGPWPAGSGLSGQHCMVMHTSGTTGEIRAMVQTDQALHLATSSWARSFRVSSDQVALPIPMAHTYGHLVAAATLLAGARLLVDETPFDPGRWARRLVAGEVTVIEAVPSVFGRLLDALDPADGALSRLRLSLSAGQQAPDRLRSAWQRRTGTELQQSWGMTELAGPGLAPLPGTCPASAGVPVMGLEVRIVNPADGTAEQLPVGVTGELWVRGPQVTPGHRADSRRPLPVTDPQGWLRTGDLARRDEHGCITLVGRSKDAIMTNGYTVQPAEVEEVLLGHPQVHEAVVLGRADEQRGEAVHAVVVPRPGESAVSASDIIDHCARLLARHKVPRTVDLVDQLPTTATGKVDRASLRISSQLPRRGGRSVGR